MKKGDIVEIYHDPLTMRELEGKAELVKFLRFDKDLNVEVWKVKFSEEWDTGTYERKIYKTA